MPLHAYVVQALQAFDDAATANTDSYHVKEHGPRATGATQRHESAASCEPLTVFHTREYLAMPLVELATVMRRATRTSDEAALVALILCCRYSARAAAPVTRHMMHRLYVTALHVGIKAHCDYTFSNATFAKFAGVSPVELQRLEVGLMKALDWQLLVLVRLNSCALGPPNSTRFRLLRYGDEAHREDAFNALLEEGLHHARTAARVRLPPVASPGTPPATATPLLSRSSTFLRSGDFQYAPMDDCLSNGSLASAAGRLVSRGNSDACFSTGR